MNKGFINLWIKIWVKVHGDFPLRNQTQLGKPYPISWMEFALYIDSFFNKGS